MKKWVFLVTVVVSPGFQNPLYFAIFADSMWFLKDCWDAQSRNDQFVIVFLLSYLLFCSGEIATYSVGSEKHVLNNEFFTSC